MLPFIIVNWDRIYLYIINLTLGFIKEGKYSDPY